MGSTAAIILVAASLASPASAAVARLTSWMSVAAAAAAVLSGGQVLRNELIVPLRIRSAQKMQPSESVAVTASRGGGTVLRSRSQATVGSQHST